MKEIVVIGAGGHAAEIDEYINHSQLITGDSKIRVKGFLDDSPDNYGSYDFSAPYMGYIKDHKVVGGIGYIIGIANLQFRRSIVERFFNSGANFETFIHSNAYVSRSASIGVGNVVGPYANIGPNVIVGNFNLINSRVSLGHDSMIGNFNLLSPNVSLSGFTKVGDENLFGINSATIPEIEIGDKNKIAAGMLVDKNVAGDSVVFHRFREKIIAVPKKG